MMKDMWCIQCSVRFDAANICSSITLAKTRGDRYDVRNTVLPVSSLVTQTNLQILLSISW